MQVSMHVHKPGKQPHKLIAVQNGTVLYGKAEPSLVPEGWHLAELIDVRHEQGRTGKVYAAIVGTAPPT